MPEPPRSPAERSAAALERIAAALERLSPMPPPIVDLDDPKGDPVVKFEPRAYKGVAQKGQSLSACSAEFLDVYATALEQGAATQTNEKWRHFDLLDAARARGWAERIRTGWKPPQRGASSPRPAPPPRAAPTRAAPPPRTSAPTSAPTPAPASTAYPPDWDADVPPADDDLDLPP